MLRIALIRTGLVLSALMAVFVAPALAADDFAAKLTELTVAADTIWVLVTGVLVMFMNCGFGMLESGFNRSKNCVNILSKNFIVYAITSIVFWMIGFGVMFGDGGKFFGTQGLWGLTPDNSPATGDDYKGVYGSLNWTSVPLVAKYFFQMVFAATAATIVSGAVAERIKYHAFILFSVAMAVVIYPVTGHWIWGGGWLGDIMGTGFGDFAGSTVVHSVGGWAALAGIIVLGPRFGKYNPDGSVNPIPGHNMMAATLGVFVLWLGWFGFNPGSEMGAHADIIAKVLVTTNTAAAAGVLAATFTSWLVLGKPDLGMTLNGCLAGLVAITSPCAAVTVAGSFWIGLIAGVIVVFGVIALDKMQLDDTVGAVPVHLFCGIWGTLAFGLFSTDAGLFYGHGSNQVIVQLIGIVGVGVYVMIAAFIVWSILKAVVGLRVSPEEELVGLDISEHGNMAYPDFVTRKFSPSLGTVSGRSREG